MDAWVGSKGRNREEEVEPESGSGNETEKGQVHPQAESPCGLAGGRAGADPGDSGGAKTLLFGRFCTKSAATLRGRAPAV